MPQRRIHIGIINSYSNSNNPVTYFHWKIPALAGICTWDLPGTKPICYQLSYSGWIENCFKQVLFRSESFSNFYNFKFQVAASVHQKLCIYIEFLILSHFSNFFIKRKNNQAGSNFHTFSLHLCKKNLKR